MQVDRSPETTLIAQRHPKPHLIQWERTLRWHQRTAEVMERGDTSTAFDLLFSLFLNILHVRDWLIASRPDLATDVQELYRESPSLALIRDIANGSKHMTLTNYSVDGSATVAREYAGGGRSRYIVPRPGGRNVEAPKLAASALGEIERFSQRRHLL